MGEGANYQTATVFCILIIVMLTLHAFVKTTRIIHQRVNFTIYNFKKFNL